MEIENTLAVREAHDRELFAREFQNQCVVYRLYMLGAIWHAVQDAINAHPLLHL
jgi:hypothetical protein